ncbi:hypothetical protein CCACVL1_29898, partial [Corchorus capsularis]
MDSMSDESFMDERVDLRDRPEKGFS